ncbi:hypothetical protein [Lyngbya sp. CCY1209]|nr:hypothetical protein [Lyngbya sp. CCY1209]MEB3882685.1 hypothetical protein [Lyngbya sp. CCY1209]
MRFIAIGTAEVSIIGKFWEGYRYLKPAIALTIANFEMFRRRFRDRF